MTITTKELGGGLGAGGDDVEHAVMHCALCTVCSRSGIPVDMYLRRGRPSTSLLSMTSSTVVQ